MRRATVEDEEVVMRRLITTFFRCSSVRSCQCEGREKRLTQWYLFVMIMQSIPQ